MNIVTPMNEAGVVIAKDGKPLFWHLPPGRTLTSIPDTRLLWDVLWEHRGNLEGFAHSHPGSGSPIPSKTDLTTFVAIEQALGRGLSWWITSSESLVKWTSTESLQVFQRQVIADEPAWAAELRRLSYNS